MRDPSRLYYHLPPTPASSDTALTNVYTIFSRQANEALWPYEGVLINPPRTAAAEVAGYAIWREFVYKIMGH